MFCHFPSARTYTLPITVMRHPLLCPTDAGDHAIVAVSDDACPVPADLSGNASRGISIQTRESRRGRACRGYGQILFGAEALHQPHHAAEVSLEASCCGDKQVRLCPARDAFFISRALPHSPFSEVLRGTGSQCGLYKTGLYWFSHS